jgi:hypothetical protein
MQMFANHQHTKTTLTPPIRVQLSFVLKAIGTGMIHCRSRIRLFGDSYSAMAVGGPFLSFGRALQAVDDL